MGKEYHTIIIGAGVAGMTAALYLKRRDKNILIFEKEAPGGQIIRTSSIENYPGYSKIEGPDLAMKMYEQITELGIQTNFQEVVSIEYLEDKTFQVETKTEVYRCKHLIIAIGRTPKKLMIPNEEKLSGKGISWCAICDGPLYKNKKVAVIGGGRSALEETIYLSEICSEVTLIHRRDEFRAENSLVESVKSLPNTTIILNDNVVEFIEKDNHLSMLRLQSGKEITVDGCFEFIGQEPNTAIFKELGILDNEGYIIVNEKLETSIKNIYACGDCIKKDLYQIITACAEGAIVAEQILKNEKK
ncbi:MAG: FAD-dependent oxidoreductase [Firmicutes bacterium]|nr:FAD-dependent oxidoreductase [Bacillota bacterium]